MRQDIAAMIRDTDAHTSTGHRTRQPRPGARRQGTRSAIVRAAVREA